MQAPTPQRPSPSLALASDALGQDVRTWVLTRRCLGQSWGRIARDLTEIVSQGRVGAEDATPCTYSRELLRLHFGDIERVT
jgi:hypothetical protein